MFVEKAFLVGLFSEELIFGGLIIGGSFAFQNGLSLITAKNSLKQPLTVDGLIFRRAYYRKEIW